MYSTLKCNVVYVYPNVGPIRFYPSDAVLARY